MVVSIVKCGMASWENETHGVSCLQLQDKGIGNILKVIGSLIFHIIHGQLAVLQNINTSIICLISSQSELEVVGPFDWCCEVTCSQSNWLE